MTSTISVNTCGGLCPTSKCSYCKRIYMQKWRRANTQKVRENKKRFHLKNPDYHKQRRLKNPEKAKEQVRLANARFRAKNPDKVRANIQRWRTANPERTLEISRKSHARNPEPGRASNLKRKYKITIEEYERRFLKQDGCCAICNQPETALASSGQSIARLAVDHDHRTGIVRGLLCSRCNKGLGHFKDDLEIMCMATEYLRMGGVDDRPREKTEANVGAGSQGSEDSEES